MGDKSLIEWLDGGASWNPIRARHPDRVEISLDHKVLAKPLHWRKGRKIFPCSMTDIFEDWVSGEWLDRIFAVMALTPQHTYMVLTKRAERMCRYFTTGRTFNILAADGTARVKTVARQETIAIIARGMNIDGARASMVEFHDWPLPNVWLFVSVEDQDAANERVPWLLDTPAAVRGVSYEPALGPVNFRGTGYGPDWLAGWDTEAVHAHDCYGEWRNCPEAQQYQTPRVDCMIVGGESGPNARPFKIEWARDVREQCKQAGTKFYLKQLGRFVSADPDEFPERIGVWENNAPPDRGPILRSIKGHDPSEWPADLRVRELPAVL